jgi:hypothetical protein
VTGDVVGSVVRDVIADLAPEELPVVRGLSELGPDVARRRLRRRRTRDPVGFGLDVAVPLMTPVAWIAVDELVRRAVDGASDSLASRIAGFLRRVWRRPAPRAAAVPPLSPAQLEQVRGRILELAPKYYLTTENAEALADRVAARLVLPAEGKATGQ